MPKPPDYENNCQTEGIFSPVAGIMGSLQANEVLNQEKSPFLCFGMKFVFNDKYKP